MARPRPARQSGYVENKIDGPLSPAAFLWPLHLFGNIRTRRGITYDPFTDTAWWFDIKGKRLHG